MIKLITIIGARPQIIKASAISRAISTQFSSEIQEIIVHTGQHYDENMSEVFFDELGIPKPTYNLNVGSGSHGAQTAKMIAGLEEIFLKEKPDGVIVYGDTNSTIAAALAAVKIYIPVIHIEAGLRSFNKAMPEEINRIACDHMSTLLFTPTQTGIDNLAKEGFEISVVDKAHIDRPNVYLCGDIMYDNSLHFSSISADKSTILASYNLTEERYILGTIHRDTNTDDPEKLQAIFEGLLEIQQQSGLSFILPIHPRTKIKMEEFLTYELLNQLKKNDQFHIIPPAGFLDIIALEKHAAMIVTDSGGLQKEAFFFQKPCLILREQTEWVEIVKNGNAILVGADKAKIIDAYTTLNKKQDFTYPEFYGDGRAAEFICKRILNDLC